MKKPAFISTANIVFSGILLAGVSLSILSYVFAAAPNPGHNFNTVGGGAVQGDILYGSAADTLSALAKDTNATRYLSNTGASNNPAWAQVNLTNGVSGVLGGINGGTNNTAMAFTGPTTSIKTFTLPDATATILTDATDVTVSQGGTGLSTLTANNVILGNGTAAPLFVAPGTSGNVLVSNGTTWLSTSGGILIGRQTLTSGTTYTPTSGTTAILIRMWGGGGAGGGCSAAAGCAGGGGGSGAYAEYYLSGVTGTFAYVIGNGGTGASGAIGGVGASTTFNTGVITITAGGGGGGAFTAGTAAIKFMAGGLGALVATNGNVNGAGVPGDPGMTSTVTTVVSSGKGGSTSLGGAGRGQVNATGAGIAATANTGSGGGGAAAIAATANAGGNGGSGVIIITEYR